ncbi:hypothetical protein [Pasteuria penetrans]|uniref:hypothetical protein n=1 Tax=Pasteuria penetrans TaxID=86005 RepID=UPI000FA07D91|nr:hypothetical protein [Pasteuria penetrans]
MVVSDTRKRVLIWVLSSLMLSFSATGVFSIDIAEAGPLSFLRGKWAKLTKSSRITSHRGTMTNRGGTMTNSGGAMTNSGGAMTNFSSSLSSGAGPNSRRSGGLATRFHDDLSARLDKLELSNRGRSIPDMSSVHKLKDLPDVRPLPAPRRSLGPDASPLSPPTSTFLGTPDSLSALRGADHSIYLPIPKQ